MSYLEQATVHRWEVNIPGQKPSYSSLIAAKRLRLDAFAESALTGIKPETPRTAQLVCLDIGTLPHPKESIDVAEYAILEKYRQCGLRPCSPQAALLALIQHGHEFVDDVMEVSMESIVACDAKRREWKFTFSLRRSSSAEHPLTIGCWRTGNVPTGGHIYRYDTPLKVLFEIVF